MVKAKKMLKDRDLRGTGLNMMKEVCDLREKILGKNHISTLSAKFEYAIRLKNENRDKEALKLFEEVIVGREQILGKAH